MSAESHFDVVETGENSWEVRHEGTELVAGLLKKDGDSYALTDSAEKDLGSFDSVDEALTVLYGSD